MRNLIKYFIKYPIASNVIMLLIIIFVNIFLIFNQGVSNGHVYDYLYIKGTNIQIALKNLSKN